MAGEYPSPIADNTESIRLPWRDQVMNYSVQLQLNLKSPILMLDCKCSILKHFIS